MNYNLFAAPTNMFNVNYWIMPVLTSKREVTVNDVFYATCIAFNVLKVQLVSKDRHKELVRARFVCMYVMKKMIKDITLNKIGKEFNRDHTTVIHAINTLNDELSVEHTKEKCQHDIRKVIGLIS